MQILIKEHSNIKFIMKTFKNNSKVRVLANGISNEKERNWKCKNWLVKTENSTLESENFRNQVMKGEKIGEKWLGVARKEVDCREKEENMGL